MARTPQGSSIAFTLAPGAAPLRHRVADAVVEAIAGGRLRPGDPLPSSRGLAGQLGIGRAAVIDAYDELLAAGYVTSVAGSGTFVAPGSDRAARLGAGTHVADSGAGRTTVPCREPTGPRWVVRAGSPDSDLIDARAWRRAWSSSAEQVATAVDPLAHHELAAALVDHLRRTRGVVVNPGRVVMVPGIAAGLRAVFDGLDLQRRTVAVEDPGYREVPSALAEVGATVRSVAVDADGLDPALLRADDAAVYVTPAHQYPLGGRLPVERRSDLLAWAARHSALIIEDDYDGEFRYGVSPLPAMRALGGGDEHVVYLGTASKMLTTGLRLAWVVAPERWVDPIATAVRRLSLGVDPTAARMLARFISSGALSRHLARASREYAHRRQSLARELTRLLPNHELLGVDAGLHLVLSLDEGADDVAIVSWLADQGMETEPLSAYCTQASARGLVLGYAQLPASAAAQVARLVARAVAR